MTPNIIIRLSIVLIASLFKLPNRTNGYLKQGEYVLLGPNLLHKGSSIIGNSLLRQPPQLN